MSEDSKPIGRPSKFDPEYVEQAYKLALLGATDKQIADFFGVSEQTLNNWKHAHADFLESLKAGKLAADSTVAQSLYRRANGYSHEAVKIMQYQGQPLEVFYTERYPPDTTAAIFWLKNRQPEVWRDKIEASINATVENKPASLPDLARELAFLLASGMQALGEDQPEPLH